MKKILTILLILCAICAFTQEYKIITKSEDGRYYLEEQAVIQLAEYIAKIEQLNQNYKMQIQTLEQLTQNLKQQIENYKSSLSAYESKVTELEKKLQTQQNSQTAFAVVAAIAIGGVVFLFVTR